MYMVMWRTKPGKSTTTVVHHWSYETSGAWFHETLEAALTYAKDRSKEHLSCDYFVAEVVAKVSSEQPPTQTVTEYVFKGTK